MESRGRLCMFRLRVLPLGPAATLLCTAHTTPIPPYICPAAEEEGELPGSPGYSPFAGSQEPGSEPSQSLPLSSPLGNSAAAAERAGWVGAGGSRSAPVSPTAARAGVVATAGLPADSEGVVHGSSLALGSLERERQLPARGPATLPRPISADNLGRVASLAHGIPRIRTRTQAGGGGRWGRGRVRSCRHGLQEALGRSCGTALLSPHAVWPF